MLESEIDGKEIYITSIEIKKKNERNKNNRNERLAIIIRQI